MKLLLKTVGYIFAGLAGVVVLAFIVLQLISDEQYKKWIVSAAASATGRELAIDGPFQVNIGSRVGLLASNVRFANASWGTRDEMATIERLFVELRLMPLIKGVLDVTMEIDAADVQLETSEAEQGNWVFVSKETEAQEEKKEQPQTGEAETSFSLPVKPYIRNLEIKDLAFVFKGGAQGKDLQANVEHLQIFVDETDIPLVLKAAFQGAPIELHGSLGNIEQWHVNQQTGISLTGKLNDADLSLTGSAGPMLPRPNASLDLVLAADNISTFSLFAGIPIPELQGLDIGLRLIAANGTLSSENIKINLADPRLMVAIQGAVADLVGVGGIDLQTELKTDQGNELLAGLNLQVPYTLPPMLRLAGTVQGDLQALSVRDLELNVNDQGLDIKLTGTLENLLFQPDGQAALTIELESTEVVANYISQELPPLGPFKAEALFSSAEGNIKLESLQAALSDPALAAEISGSTQAISRTADGAFEVNGIDISAWAKSSRLEEIAKRARLELPVALPASFSIDAVASGDLSQLSVTEIKALVKDEGVEVQLNVSVENVLSLTGVVAKIAATVSDTAALSKFAGQELPSLGSLDLQAQVVSEGKTYRLKDAELVLAGEAINAKINGATADLLGLAQVAAQPEILGSAGIDVSITADTPSVAKLAALAGVTIPEVGALQLDGHLGSAGQALALDSFNATLDHGGLKTTAALTIADIVVLSDIHAVIDGRLDSLAELADLTGAELPDTDPWELEVKVDSDKLFSSPALLLAQLDGEGIRAVFDASIADITAPQTFETQLDIEVESIVRIGRLFGREAPKDKPLKITGNAAGKPGDYRINEFLIEAGESKIMADLAYLVPLEGASGRKNISGQVTIENFDSSAWLISQEKKGDLATEEGDSVETVETKSVDAEKAATGGTKQKAATGKKIFSNDPLSFGVLSEYDAELKLDVTNMLVRNEITLNGTVGINLDQGLLKIDPFEIDQSSGATGNGYLTLDARNPEAQLDVDFDFENFVSPRFGGQIDLNVDLDGSGESLAELMGSLNGYFVASINDIELKKSYMSNFGAGLLSQLNPLDSDTTILECAVVRFDITDGIADFHKKIAAQTKEVSWLGGGEINLKTEELDFGISPKPRGAISSLTNIDLVSLVHVGGTLAEPRIGVDALDVAKKYGQYTAFIATGGLSFLAQKAYETTRANMNHCERIVADLEQAGEAEQAGEDKQQGEKKSN